MRAVRHHSLGRTNQFEVDERLEGLEEKFRVVGREPLAFAFKKRLEALEPHNTRWSPEILHLLLELSDRPVEESKITDLDQLHESDEEEGPRLTWRDIAKEDGWDDDGALWTTVDYSGSSDDGGYEDNASTASDRSDETSVSTPEKPQRTTGRELLVQPRDESLLELVEQSQAWRYTAPDAAPDGKLRKTALSEYQVLREVLFMMAGLETSLFDAKCNPILDYQLAGVSWDSYKALISSFAECGRTLLPLRKFAASTPEVPLMQVFQDSVQKSLASLDERLTAVQRRFVEIHQDVVVSLIGVLAELRPSLMPLYVLAGIIRQLQKEPHAHAFRYLELLFDAAGTAQLDGSDSTYKLLGSIFFACFQVYLRPIRLWMEEGRLVAGDRTFFVSESTGTVPMPLVWKDQFRLLRTADGALHAPRFLQPAIQKIFTTGKSIVLLKHLGRYESNKAQWMARESAMNMDMLYAADQAFAPFSEWFGDAFSAWIESKHHSASATLQRLLFDSYGLASGLDALQTIYLMTDGSQADAFASAIFRHLDELRTGWKDRFTLTELAQEAFSSSVDSYRLSARIDRSGNVHSVLASRASVRVSIPGIRLVYRLPWPVQVIITEEAIRGYQTLFTFLLQVRRAIQVLASGRFCGSDSNLANNDHRSLYYLLRMKLSWFSNSLMSYLTSLVLAPHISSMRERMLRTVDVDEMVHVHSSFLARITSGCCLGTKLQPIRECILDMLDLTLKLEDARRIDALKQAEEKQEISRLSAASSPVKGRAPKPKAVYVNRREQDEDDTEGLDAGLDSFLASGAAAADKSYAQVLREIHGDFERHLRFITAGLRGVARASRNDAAAEWDLLAGMLEVGIREQR